MSFKKSFSPELNGIRGCAILAVLFFHANIPYFKGGAIGVDIFYVLSGFLITRILLNEFDRSGSINFKNFYIRRFLRLFPALVSVLIVFCIAGFWIVSREDALRNLKDALVSLFYMANWAKAFGWIQKPVFFGHTWSLSTEEQFYIFWPVTLWLLLGLLKDRWKVLLAAASLALLSWAVRIGMTTAGLPVDRILYGLDSRGDGLMIGCALGILFESGLIKDRHLPPLSQTLAVLIPIGVILLAFITAFLRIEDGFMLYAGLTLVEVISAAMILQIYIRPDGFFSKILAHPWLVYLGTISYGLYLWHFPIFKALRYLGYDKWVLISAGSALSLLVAAASYRFLEAPILKLKERFSSSPAGE